ncbi:MAG: pyridoxamine 5'-phosphate oxidase family protein [Nitrososphaeraceae archaeon]
MGDDDDNNNNNNNNNKYIQSLVCNARVARLATIDFEEVKPHIVPVVFVFDGNSYYIPIDEKPKRDDDPEQLRRVRNIQKNPNVALLIDEYKEDWSKLVFIMIQGKGSLIGKSTGQEDVKKVRKTEVVSKQQHHQRQHIRNSSKSRYIIKNAQNLLLEKYPQYQKIGVGQLCIMICPEKVFTWKMSNGKPR